MYLWYNKKERSMYGEYQFKCFNACRSICVGMSRLLLISLSSAVKEATVLMTMFETTLEKVNHILDDVNKKLELLDRPVELVNGFFSGGLFKTGMFSFVAGLRALLRRKNNRKVRK